MLFRFCRNGGVHYDVNVLTISPDKVLQFKTVMTVNTFAGLLFKSWFYFCASFFTAGSLLLLFMIAYFQLKLDLLFSITGELPLKTQLQT